MRTCTGRVDLPVCFFCQYILYHRTKPERREIDATYHRNGDVHMNVDYIVFTDASSRTGPDGDRYTAAAAIILNTKTNRYTEIVRYLGDRTSQYGEAYAIALGLGQLSRYLDSKKHGVLVVTDSKLCVNAINLWIPKVWNTMGKRWTKKDGSEVKNQDQYKKIMGIIEGHPRVKYRLVHINSHRDPKKDWKRAKSKLEKAGIKLNQETSSVFIEMNNRVDRLAQDETASARNDRESGVGFYHLIRR